MKTAVIIPAFNEQDSIGKVIKAIPKAIVSEIIVVNNNSTDSTAEMAQKAGATVLSESFQGYGASCLTGIEYCNSKDFEIILFLDGDYSDYPEEAIKLLEHLV